MRTLVMGLAVLLVAVLGGGAVGPPSKPDPEAEMKAMARKLSFAPPPEKDAKAELEMLARKLPFFQTYEFVYHSDHHQMPGGVHPAYEKVVRPLFQRAYPVASLLPLLKHPNPRVRTLAAAGLYAYEDPRLLLEMVPLLEDRAATFVEVDAPGNFRLSNPNAMPPIANQRVKDVARRFINAYLASSGYEEGRAPGKGPPDFAGYWARRKDRTFWAGWFALRLIRVCRGSSSPPRERLEAVRSLRKEIDRLPAVDRAVTLLWLWDQFGGTALVSEKELVEACKRIGPDRVLDLFRRKPISTDPDVFPRGRQHLDPPIVAVLLPNAKQLLRPKGADALIACASVEGNYSRAEWFIAAANLQPKRAGAILDLGWEKSSGSLQIAFARWRLLPEEGTAPVVKRFYDALPRDSTYSQRAREEFIRELREEWQPKDRELLIALVRDKRFATLDWTCLEILGYVINEVEKKVVIELDELRKAHHPLGQSHVDWSVMGAEKKYPKETAELRRRLEIWRGIYRRHLLRP